MKDHPFPDYSDGIIRVIEFTENHLTEKYVSWLNDPLVVRFSEQRHFKHTLQSCREYYSSQKSSADYFLAIEHEDIRFGHIGNIGVAVDRYNKAADLRIIIGDKRVWRMGIGKRAWTAVMKNLLEVLGFRIVTAGTMEVNEPMIGLMKSSGMHIHGIIPRRFLWEGREVGLVFGSTGIR